MRIKTKAWLLAMLFLISLAPASAMTFGEARVNTTFVVSGLHQGALVQFVLNGGVPVFAAVENGTARYLPLLEGNLDIVVVLNDMVIERNSTTVLPVLTITPTPTATTTTGGGGGGSTGGGGVVTSEPYANIAKSESHDKSLIANTSVTYTFNVPELGVYEIAVTGKESENDIALRVEVLKGTSKLVKVQATGIVYKNVNVWTGTKRMKEALIRFRVENSWLGSNSLAGSDIKMVRWDGSKWDQIETTVLRSDSTYTYYEAKTFAFSSFAITGLKDASTASLTPGGTQAGTPISGTPGATPGHVATPGTAAPPTTLFIVGVLILIGIIAVVVIKRKEIFKKKE